MSAKPHFAVNAFTLKLLFQRAQRLVDVVVTNNDLHDLICFRRCGSVSGAGLLGC